MTFMILWIFVQIILESLPVSSSGHVVLLRSYCQNIGLEVVTLHQEWVIDFLLHGPTIIIVLLFFFKHWWKMLFQKPISIRIFLQRYTWIVIARTMLFGIIVDGITTFFWWKNVMFNYPLFIGFGITILILYSLKFTKKSENLFDWNYGYAICLGLVQSCSLIPGVSRFATTYAVGRWYGYSNQVSFNMSFLIQFPLILAAFCKGLFGLKNHGLFIKDLFDLKILFAILSATIISYIVLHVVNQIIQKGELWRFSWYMFVPMILTFFV